MSLTAAPADLLPLEDEQYVASSAPDAMVMQERSPYQPLFLAFPALIAALGSLTEMTLLTDVAFVVLTVLCIIFLFAELKAFSFRWGIGGLLLYGGVLVWFCLDYFSNWFGMWLSLEDPAFPPETVARAGMHHIVFVMCMALGLRIKLKGRLEGFLAKFPEPASPKIYVMLVLMLLVVGFSPYAIFTREGLFMAFWNDFMGGRASGAAWTAGRTGNVNFNYGAYLAQVVQLTIMAAVLGGFYAVMIAKTWAGRLFGIAAWVPAAMLGFGSGARGQVVTVFLPILGFLFIRFQAEAAAALRRISVRGYMALATLLMVMLLLVQLQITFRNDGFRDARVDTVLDRKIEGNSMFSESLKGFYLVPKFLTPFYDRYPGQAIVTPILESAFWFVVSPIPRAIWTTKPIDPVWLWYNNVVAGTEGTEGTTISNGAVGIWYFRFGYMGTIQGGLFVGFLMGSTERLLRYYAPMKPILVLVALGNATFLFRAYRGLFWVEYHVTLTGLVALATLIFVLNTLFGGGGNAQAELEERQ